MFFFSKNMLVSQVLLLLESSQYNNSLLTQCPLAQGLLTGGLLPNNLPCCPLGYRCPQYYGYIATNFAATG